MDEFKALAIQEAVNKLFSEKHFSICTLDNIIKLTGAPVNHGIYDQLRAFHCSHFASMSNRTRQLLQQKVVECLRGDPFLNPARVLQQLTDEGRDFAFTEDRFIDGPIQ
ncbi:hypothetical protein [Marinobacter sp. BGYM27]|uniref:hypothetical protein n=1 Tax=Marinobacter sp. BGYM27 TaxID=2975597 RepID=UPI0021A6E195|nr:hypothetical protein [Marinobacter sp. BGYM27]MDG5498922.1 hypothetical protein [Marinobacter sp. BGYM27]